MFRDKRSGFRSINAHCRIEQTTSSSWRIIHIAIYIRTRWRRLLMQFI